IDWLDTDDHQGSRLSSPHRGALNHLPVYRATTVSPAENASALLWDRPEEDVNGNWLPPTVRCDNEPMGPGSLPSFPEHMRVRYHGACIFPDVSRIYQTDVNHVKRGPVAAHIWKAFNKPDETIPLKPPGTKIIPGN
ncbi:hypothetical protein, partial [Nonomuraea africana]